MKLSAFHSLTARPLRRWSLLALTLVIPIGTFAAAPAWWTTRNVMDPGQTLNDYAAVNTGQLKHIAQKAMEEMDDKLTGGAGTAIHALVDSWDTIQPDTNDYAAVNVGQVKAVAKLFYQRLNTAGYTQPLPWNDSDPERNDYAAANIGQVKSVFAFCIDCGSGADTDADGLADWLELQLFGNLASSATTDTDSDGMPDWWELLHFNQSLTQTSSGDADADGLSNLLELKLGTNPAAGTTHTLPATQGLSVHTPLLPASY